MGWAVNVLFGLKYPKSRRVQLLKNTDAYIFPVPISPVTNTYVTFKRDNGFTGSSMSGFGEVTANLSDKIELAGGARWSYEAELPIKHHFLHILALPEPFQLA